jgi:hypothetical protein
MRQRIAEFYDAGARFQSASLAARFWSAAVLCRFAVALEFVAPPALRFKA